MRGRSLSLSITALCLFAPVVVTCGSGFPKTVRTSNGMWSSVCPSELEDVERGAHCAPAGAFDEAPDTRPVCDYPEGYCGCEPRGNAGEYVWVCKPDPAAVVCPFDRHERPIDEGDACDQVGKICSYDEGDTCFRSYTCREGRWRAGALTCHAQPASR